jgi:hypothetical protein
MKFYHGIHKKNTNFLGEMSDFNVKRGGAYNNHWALKFYRPGQQQKRFSHR